MATSGAELEKKLAAVRAAIAAGIDTKRNRQRERYLTERLKAKKEGGGEHGYQARWN